MILLFDKKKKKQKDGIAEKQSLGGVKTMLKPDVFYNMSKA